MNKTHAAKNVIKLGNEIMNMAGARFHIQTTAKGALACRVGALQKKKITIVEILTAGCDAIERKSK